MRSPNLALLGTGGLSLLAGLWWLLGLPGLPVRLELRPGWEWLIEDGLGLTVGALLISAAGLWLVALAFLRSHRTVGRALLVMAGLGTGFAAFIIYGIWIGHAVFTGEIRVHHFGLEGGGRAVVLVDGGLSPRAQLFLADRSDEEPRRIADAYLDGAGLPRVRQSMRTGRVALVDVRGVLEGIVDLGAGRLITDPAEYPDLDSAREEFGDGIRLEEPSP